jgi:hypothetical protein
MAEAQKSLLKNSDSLGNIRSSLMSFGEGLRSANSASNNIITGLNVNNREKQRAILRKSELFASRREAVRRKEREDVIEAGKLPSIVGSATRTISRSSKGFLGRVMDFVGTIFIGWMLTNLPMIIKSVQQLIGRIQELRQVLQSWLDNVSEFYQDFTAQLDTYLDRINGVLNDGTVGEAEKNNQKMESSIRSLEGDLNRMIQFFKDFDLAKFIKESIAALTGQPLTGYTGQGSPQPGQSTASAGRFAPILNLIGSAEGGYTSIAPGDENPNLTSMTIAQANQAVGVKGGRGAIGRYQLTDPLRQATEAGLDVDKDIFSPENQDKIALSLIRGRGITADMIINNPVEAARRLAMEFAGIPVLAPTQGYVQPVERGQSFYRGYNGNRATIESEEVEAAFKQFENYKPPVRRSPTSSTTINPSTRYRKGQNVSNILGKSASITSLLGAPRSHGPHGGIDIGCDPGLYVSLRVDCEVVGTARGGGYGEVIDVWVESLGVQLRFAHSTRHIISRPGTKIPAGTSFTITGYTGTVDPPGPAGSHIHFEANTNKGSRTYGSNTSPDPYVSLIQLTSVQIQGTSQQLPAAQVSSPPRSATEPGSTTGTDLKPATKTRTIPIPIIDPTQPPPPGAPQPTGGGPSAPSLSLSTGDELNRFISLMLLTELGNV